MPFQLEILSKNSNGDVQSYNISLKPATNDAKITAPDGYEILQDGGESYYTELKVKPNPGQRPARIHKTILIRQTDSSINSGSILHSLIGGGEEDVLQPINQKVSVETPVVEKQITFLPNNISFSVSKPGTFELKEVGIRTRGITNVQLQVSSPYVLSADNTTFNDNITFAADAIKGSEKVIYILFQPAEDGTYPGSVLVRYGDINPREIKLQGSCKKRNWIIPVIILAVLLLVAGGIWYYKTHPPKPQIVTTPPPPPPPIPRPIQPITGPGSVCVGQTISLSDNTTGGEWSSSDKNIAGVSQNGAVTGENAGSVTIHYKDSLKHDTAKVVIVNALPAIESPTSTVIQVGGKISLRGKLANGTWNSSDTNIASVDAASGVVTGINAGKAIISYTLNSGCATSIDITIRKKSTLRPCCNVPKDRPNPKDAPTNNPQPYKTSNH